MTVRLSAASATPPTVFVFAVIVTEDKSAPESETGATIAVPAGRPSGVRTAKTASPERERRTGVHVCGGVKSKGNCEGRATVAVATDADALLPETAGVLKERMEALTAAVARGEWLVAAACAFALPLRRRCSARARRARMSARCRRHHAREWRRCRL